MRMNAPILRLAGFMLCLAFWCPDAGAQIITTIAGNGVFNYGGDGGPGTAASVEYLHFGVADTAGNLIVSDNFNDRIREINTAGIISTFAGDGAPAFGGDGGPATLAHLTSPRGVTMDRKGNLYIADANNSRIRKVDTAGNISTYAGNGIIGFAGDGGPATAAEFTGLIDLVADTAGNIYAADGGNARVRKIDTSGIITTIAGTGGTAYTGDGGPATLAQIQAPGGLALDKYGNLYIAIDNCNCVRKVNAADGIIHTIAGNNTMGFSGDGGPATAASLSSPADIAVDSALNLYISDHGNNRIRRIDTLGIIQTIAGTGAEGYAGDGGPATGAAFYLPMGVNLDRQGNIYVCDWGNYRLRKITLPRISIASTTSDTICAGAAKSFTAVVTNDAAAPVYQWKLNNSNTGTGTSSYTTTMLHNGDVITCVLTYLLGDAVTTVSNAIRITVDTTLPDAGAITGHDSVCTRHQTLLADTAAGGAWSASNMRALVVSGSVSGIAAGLDTIRYTVTNACGSRTALFPVVVVATCPDGIQQVNPVVRDGLILQPNPNTGNFTCTVRSQENEEAILTMTSLDGRKILRTTTLTNKPIILESGAPAGIYFISAATGHGVWCEQVLIY